MPSVTASTNSKLSFRIADFETLVDGLDYAAGGETGCNFFSPRGELQASLTYREIRDRAVALAQRLTRAGFERGARVALVAETGRSEEHTSELQSLMRISYAVFCL